MPVHLGRQTPELVASTAVHGTGVRVQEQLRGVPAGAGPRVPAAVHPEAVPLSGPHPGHETVPDLMGQLGQRHPDLDAVALPRSPAAPVVGRAEKTQLDRLGPARPQREVGARDPVGPRPVARPERGRRTRPHGDARRRARRAVHRGGRLRGQSPAEGTPLPRGLPHCLLLGCARHPGPSRGSVGAARGGPRRPGRGLLSRRPPPVLPRAGLALTFPEAEAEQGHGKRGAPRAAPHPPNGPTSPGHAPSLGPT